MASEWQKDRMSFKPHEFENGGKDTWIQRKNIKEIRSKDPETEEETIEYEADMRFINNKEYEILMSKKQQETSENAEKTASQELSLMEAMADLYELLLSGME